MVVDTEDFIIVKVLNSLTDICESKLIRARVSTNIIAIVVRFLVHPNLWIQEAVAGYIAMAAKDLSPADIYCIVYPQVRPFLRNEIVGISAMLFYKLFEANYLPKCLRSLSNGHKPSGLAAKVSFGFLRTFIESFQAISRPSPPQKFRLPPYRPCLQLITRTMGR